VTLVNEATAADRDGLDASHTRALHPLIGYYDIDGGGLKSNKPTDPLVGAIGPTRLSAET